jgi:hypothetical protein
MTLYSNSRYLKTLAIPITDEDGNGSEIYSLMQTTVMEDDLGEFDWYTVKGDELLEDIAYEVYYNIGGADLWWVLAMANPEVEYPLDLSSMTRIRIPPTTWVQSFIKELDDWEYTWRNNPK